MRGKDLFSLSIERLSLPTIVSFRELVCVCASKNGIDYGQVVLVKIIEITAKVD